MWVDPARPRPLWRGDYCSRLLADPAWVVEPKWNGERLIIVDGVGWTRQRKRSRCPLPLPRLPHILDGEWLARAGPVIVWDAPTIEGPLSERWAWVVEHVPDLGSVRRTIRLQPATAWERAMELGAEGMVLKSDGPYPRGDTYQWLKVKG